MRAIQIKEPQKVQIIDLPTPIPGPGEVFIRILTAGLCGTDLHLYDGNFGTFPMIPGHDVAGVIEKVGGGVSSDRIGTRVTIDPAACCLRSAAPVPFCPACARGATNLCIHGTYMGISAPGAMAEWVTLPAKRAIPLPEEIDDASATVLEPVAVGLHLLEQIADRSGPVLVIGGGPIGIVAALLLQDANHSVWLSEHLEKRRNVAEQLGIKKVTSPDQLQSPLDIQIIVETSAHPSAAETIVRDAPAGSTIVLVGGATDIPGLTILTRELEVRAVKGGRGLYPEAVSLVASKKINLSLLISHTFPGREAAEAFRVASRHRSEVTRAVLDMTEW